MVDLTRDQNGQVRARLLDLVLGRSGPAYARWLDARQPVFRAQIKTAALDPFRGYANALRDSLPDALQALDAFHVVKVRHEAPGVPSGGERPPPPGLSQQPGEAEGSLIRETPGRAASSPDNDGTGRYCQTARVRQARREGVAPA